MTTTTVEARRSSPAAERQAGYDRFVAYVARRCEEPAARAALRSGVRRDVGEAPRMHRVIAAQVPAGLRLSVERAFYSVAALIAAQPRQARDEEREQRAAARAATEESPDATSPASGPAEPPQGRRNFGATLAEAVKAHKFTRDNAEARVHLLTRQGVAGVHRHLPGVVSHLRADRIQVDWGRLLNDLARWESYRTDVAKEWLQAFYRVLEAETDKDDATKADTPPTNGA